MIILTQEILQKVTDNHAFIVLVRSIAMRANNNQTCFPSINKICEDTSLSKPTVIKALSYLVEKKIISKKSIVRHDGGFSSNFYTICTEDIKVAKAVKLEKQDEEVVKEIYPLVNEVDKGSQGDLPPLVNEVDSNSQVQIELTSKDNSNKKETKKISSSKSNFNSEEYVKNLDRPEIIKKDLIDLIEIRRMKKTATSERSIELILQNLDKWAGDDLRLQQKIIETSIERGWTGIFEPKESPPNYSKNYNRPEEKKYADTVKKGEFIFDNPVGFNN